MSILDMVISGGQNGADLAGLAAAYDLGIKTGGTAPKGYRVCNYDGSDSANPELASKYRLVESTSYDYPPRTKLNVMYSDGTVWFGYEHSPGGKLTIKTCHHYNKPLLINPKSTELRQWIISNNIKVLNVAGNRVSEFNPNIYDTTYFTIYEALK